MGEWNEISLEILYSLLKTNAPGPISAFVSRTLRVSSGQPFHVSARPSGTIRVKGRMCAASRRNRASASPGLAHLRKCAATSPVECVSHAAAAIREDMYAGAIQFIFTRLRKLAAVKTAYTGAASQNSSPNRSSRVRHQWAPAHPHPASTTSRM